jgi:DNA-directed RNA polymerase subunit RPC12/RpoP
MKPGEDIQCPQCGKNTFLKKVAVLDGWTKTGEILACAACNAKIADLKPEEKESPSNDAAANKLANFLGGAEKEKIPEIKAAAGEKRFCRDCRHLVAHPFLTRCERHKKNVNPMDDCPDFTVKSS